MDSKELRAELRKAIKAAGGYAVVADRLGLSERSLYTYVYLSRPRLSTLARLASALGLRVRITFESAG